MWSSATRSREARCSSSGMTDLRYRRPFARPVARAPWACSRGMLVRPRTLESPWVRRCIRGRSPKCRIGRRVYRGFLAASCAADDATTWSTCPVASVVSKTSSPSGRQDSAAATTSATSLVWSSLLSSPSGPSSISARNGPSTSAAEASSAPRNAARSPGAPCTSDSSIQRRAQGLRRCTHSSDVHRRVPPPIESAGQSARRFLR
jgi:hypothetical protein